MLALTHVLLQTYDVGLFATEDSSYLPCGIASMVDSHPAARFNPDKMGQYQNSVCLVTGKLTGNPRTGSRPEAVSRE
jgi:hypothetical protein